MSCLDFGDLSGGSIKSLPLKMVNRTRATVPIRLVISAVSKLSYITSDCVRCKILYMLPSFFFYFYRD